MSLSIQVDTTLPALGFVATESNTDIVAVSSREAHERGHAVFVIPESDALVDEVAGVLNENRELPAETAVRTNGDAEGARFAHVLGRNQPLDDFTEHSSRAALAAVAESHSLPGIIFYGAVSDQPDFDRLPDTGDSEFVIDAFAPPSTEQSLLVAIPAYNEAESIAGVVRTARRYAESVLVVDDGSTDETTERARAAGATVVRHRRNQGYGSALRTAFREATERETERLVTIDADGQHEPADIPRLVERQRETGAEIVVGSRFVDETPADTPLYRRLGLRAVNWLANLSIGLVNPDARVNDTQSGFRAYDRRAIESLAADQVVGAGMGASTDILYHACDEGYLIEEVPTTIYYHVENASTHNPFVHGFGLTRNLLRTIERDRPLSVLALPGFVLVLSAFVIALWTVSSYTTTGTLPLVAALFSGAIGTVGGFIGLAGIVLHALNTHGGHP